MPNFIDVPSFKLNTGASIPAVGLGTWQSPADEVSKAVETALKAGYRHIDGAWIYGQEKAVGEGIRAANIPRDQLFYTSKLWTTKARDPLKAIDETLELTGLDYVDLYLIHWPVALNGNGNDPKFPTKPDGSRDLDTEWSIEKTWEGMEKVLASGKAKAIGISNFSIPFIERLLKTAKVTPAANQVELHPYLPQHELVEFCKSKGILVEAYSPLGSTNSPLLSDSTVSEIAKKHDVSTGTVLISYQVARGVVVLPKSVTPSRIESNYKIVKLDEDDMKQLNKLVETKRTRFVKPNWGMSLGFEDM